MEIVIKKMETEEEIRGKAYVHWKSWQEAYAGLVDTDYLASRSLARCEERARKWPDTWIAKDGERVVGFTVACVCRDDNGVEIPDEGEVRAIYVLEEYQKRRIGYALMRYALSILAGCRVVYVWVLQGNEKAIRFYERVGFRADGAEQELVFGTPVKAIRMTYIM